MVNSVDPGNLDSVEIKDGQKITDRHTDMHKSDHYHALALRLVPYENTRKSDTGNGLPTGRVGVYFIAVTFITFKINL